jgi:hypothetical protein
MRQRAPRLLVLVALLQATALSGETPRAPVLVELFTSEGCSSCPPADVLLQKLADDTSGAPVIALGEHVDYWDRQGWKDRFSSAALTARQQVYAAHFNIDSVYTPQMVVDGRAELVGSDAGAALRAIERAAAQPHGVVRIAPDAQRSGTSSSRVAATIEVSNLPAVSGAVHADLVVAITEDDLSSNVTRGENHGRVLKHAAVVRRLTTIGDAPAPGAPARIELALDSGWKRERLTVVAFVQERRSRTILASAATRLSLLAQP